MRLPDDRRATEREWEQARQLLARAAGDDQTATGLANATARVVDRLDAQLRDLVGPRGVAALFRRSLYLARTECPELAEVEVRDDPRGERLAGLQDLVQAADPVAAQRCLVTLLANVLWLLVSFVGQDIVMRLIGRIEGEASGSANPGSKEDAR